MSTIRPRSLALIAIFCSLLSAPALAGELKLSLPKKDKFTPVQKLNRDGVKAVQKHDYAKARKLFYQAYLIDPNDPFTLNNLGYIAELEGDAERAQRYYALSSEHHSEAKVDTASTPGVAGKPVSQVAGAAVDDGMTVNRLNVAAINLLQKDRAPEADVMLQKALAIDRKNPFTLNNMGYAKEKQGELEAALNYYTAAWSTGSMELVVVTIRSSWRGKPIAEVAEENAKNLRKAMRKAETTEARVRRLNLRGVSAMNRNDRRTARQLFEQAYALDPNDAFTLNNMGFLAELDGDRETADFYYARAQEAKRRNARVTVATRREVEGREIGDVAEETEQAVQARMQQDVEAKRRQGGEPTLKRRDNTPVQEPSSTPRLTPR